ncbi:hypothetical protein AVEN_249753-1 [Araneus ventricosus]|uniref:Uncharacterized protein n=1 Tax=Araneus ventricosus TaxID=182803 RepID=A0A4Y2C7B9_ARAVE|nr:hypothetical protein AVEN_249753-1 [Araneus ventricosus]
MKNSRPTTIVGLQLSSCHLSDIVAMKVLVQWDRKPRNHKVQELGYKGIDPTLSTYTFLEEPLLVSSIWSRFVMQEHNAFRKFTWPSILNPQKSNHCALF